MIVYDLQCSHAHRFEGWFASDEDYLKQKKTKMLLCPICGDQQIEKVPAGFQVNQKSNQKTEGSRGTPSKSAIALKQLEAIEERVIQEIVKNTEDVGERFAEEARKMHYQETPQRGIRGKSTADEAQELAEEGIDVTLLPFALPDKDKLQ